MVSREIGWNRSSKTGLFPAACANKNKSHQGSGSLNSCSDNECWESQLHTVCRWMYLYHWSSPVDLFPGAWSESQPVFLSVCSAHMSMDASPYIFPEMHYQLVPSALILSLELCTWHAKRRVSTAEVLGSQSCLRPFSSIAGGFKSSWSYHKTWTLRRHIDFFCVFIKTWMN